jgi:YkoY family integral membrane protein
MPPDLWSDLSVIAALVLIEGLLSVDNALGIAAFANRLPEHQRHSALRLGFIGAYGFRVLALLSVTLIINNKWVMVLGALYLVYLMCAEVTKPKGEEEENECLGERQARFWPSVARIGLLDLSLSLDNVVTAVAFTEKLWLIYVGVLIAICVLRFFAGWCLRLLVKYPFLEKTAFILVGYVGLVLLGKLWFGLHIEAVAKFAGVLGIVVLSFVHAKQRWFRRLLAPVFAVLAPVMRAAAWVGGLPVTLILAPLWRLFKGRAAPVP